MVWYGIVTFIYKTGLPIQQRGTLFIHKIDYIQESNDNMNI